ncbi:AEC family transporter [Jannaschia sp. LMIT008]|uniref:AEC family transporter n=1 Tax=Jannaschia maritima TaxID=3032585 RepID=UPI0028128848|nr:AEC family transporter [Jannaschia sp. LMIT008]
MLDVLAVTIPVFLLIGAGYLAVRLGAFTQGHVDGLMVFTQRFAIPCLLFVAIARIDIGANFQWRLLTAYYSGSLVVFAGGILGTLFWLRRGAEDAIAVGFAAMFANTVLLGLPISERAFGTDSLGPNYAIVALHAGFCYVCGSVAMEAVRAEGSGILGGAWSVLSKLARNGLMIGVALGLAVNVTGLPVPAIVMEPVGLVAQAALPAALFGLGGVLTQYRPEGDWRGIALCAGLALLIHPAWTWGMGRALGVEDGAFRAAVTTAAMAPGVNSYLFAAMNGRAVRIAASTVLIGTVASVFTVSLWLLALG